MKANQKIISKLAKSNQNSYRLKLTINVLGSKGFDLYLLKANSQSTVVSYDMSSVMLSFDRTKSGNVDFHKRFPSIEKISVKPENGILKLDILVDKSVVEIYANDGKAVMTDLVFPLKNSSGIEITWK